MSEMASHAEESLLRPALGSTWLLLFGLLLWTSWPARGQETSAELTRLPELVECVEPAYPVEAQQAGIESTVLLEIQVDPTGAVTAVSVLGSGGATFDAAAVEAAEGFVFSPAYAGEEPVPVVISYEMAFTLEPDSSEYPPPVSHDPSGAPENLCGKVCACGGSDPVLAASVYIQALGLETVTDAGGSFCFVGVPLGTWEITVRAPGYKPYLSAEEVLEDQRTDVAYYLRPSPRGVARTIVRSERERREVSHIELVAEEIRKVPGSLGDPIKAVQNLPGVARAPYDLGVMVVRGSGPEDTGQYVDGVRVPLLYHFGALRSVISPGSTRRTSIGPSN